MEFVSLIFLVLMAQPLTVVTGISGPLEELFQSSRSLPVQINVAGKEENMFISGVYTDVKKENFFTFMHSE